MSTEGVMISFNWGIGPILPSHKVSAIVADYTGQHSSCAGDDPSQFLLKGFTQ